MISREDADRTLKDIDSTMDRASLGFGYRAAAPHLILWGVVWFLGYGLSAVVPDLRAHWIGLVALGAIGSAVAGGRGGAGGAAWKYVATALLAAGFFVALFSLLPPLDSRQVGALFPLVVSALYGGFGIWTCRAKFGLTGAAVGGVALGAYFLAPGWFDPLMAIVGGGALLLGGLWMRRW